MRRCRALITMRGNQGGDMATRFVRICTRTFGLTPAS
jgi:hypothetical protein